MSHGLLGVAMGTIVPMLVVKIVIQPWYALNAAEMNGWEYFCKGLGRPLIVGLLFVVVAGKISISAETTAPLFAATVGCQIIIFLVFAWLFGLTGAERQWLWEYGRQHLGSPVLRHTMEVSPQGTEGDLR